MSSATFPAPVLMILVLNEIISTPVCASLNSKSCVRQNRHFPVKLSVYSLNSIFQLSFRSPLVLSLRCDFPAPPSIRFGADGRDNFCD